MGFICSKVRITCQNRRLCVPEVRVTEVTRTFGGLIKMLQKWKCPKCEEEFWYDVDENIEKVYCKQGHEMVKLRLPKCRENK